MEANATHKVFVMYGREDHSWKILANISEKNKQLERRKRILKDNIKTERKKISCEIVLYIHLDEDKDW